jgi:hypothetical protein
MNGKIKSNMCPNSNKQYNIKRLQMPRIARKQCKYKLKINLNLSRKKCGVYSQEDFLYKIVHSVSLIKKYFKYLIRSHPTEFADSTQNYHKFIKTPHQSIRMKIFSKKK